ncbi:MAG TPA: RNA methyltransferase [Candidatus Hydrogenedentes bacterium]|nr:RNA methyltransferase [Candidatus Hydrogenedentota bacterium]
MPGGDAQSRLFHVGGAAYSAAEIIRVIGEYLTPERRARIAAVVAERTRSVVPVLEGLYDHGNVCAVMRTAEALGYQALHIVDLQEKFKVANRVTQGAEKWIDLHRWATTRACVVCLRARGYRIAAMCMEDAQPIDAYPFDAPTALFFGGERDGVSRELLDDADARLVIPMPGFTRSFNISVAAGVALHHIREARIRVLGRHGDLDDAEQAALTAAYYLRSVEHAAQLLSRHGPPEVSRAVPSLDDTPS